MYLQCRIKLGQYNHHFLKAVHFFPLKVIVLRKKTKINSYEFKLSKLIGKKRTSKTLKIIFDGF